MGEHCGAVETCLRSTRIRTNDPHAGLCTECQIANMSLENFSARDRFWFHPMVGLRYETTAVQMRSVTGELHKLLTTHPSLDSSSVRVRFCTSRSFFSRRRDCSPTCSPVTGTTSWRSRKTCCWRVMEIIQQQEPRLHSIADYPTGGAFVRQGDRCDS